MGEIYKIITIAQGEPPKPDESFVWEYYTAKGDYKKWEGTPLEFYKVSLRAGSGVFDELWGLMKPLWFIGVQQQAVPASRGILAHQRPEERVRQALHRREAWQCLGWYPYPM